MVANAAAQAGERTPTTKRLVPFATQPPKARVCPPLPVWISTASFSLLPGGVSFPTRVAINHPPQVPDDFIIALSINSLNRLLPVVIQNDK